MKWENVIAAAFIGVLVTAVFFVTHHIYRDFRSFAPDTVTPWHSDSLGITCLVQRGEIKACLWDVERPAR